MSDPCPQTLSATSNLHSSNSENPKLPPEHDPDDDDNESTKLRRQLRLILNKIAWRNYHQLRDELLQLDLNQNEIFQKTAAVLLLDKASGEPLYTQIYSQLCSDICGQNPERSEK